MAKRIGVLLSGRGSNFEALSNSVAAGRIPGAEIAVVVSNREGAPGIDKAKERKIAARVIPSKGLEREAYDRQVVAVLNEHKVDLVCLAGYMRLLSPFFVASFPNRILNIHPSLLPSFPGPQAYRQAYEGGVKIAGVTAHFVSMRLDEGPIIAQGSFEIGPGLALPEIIARGQQLEAKVLVKAVKLYLGKRMDVHWGVVREV